MGAAEVVIRRMYKAPFVAMALFVGGGLWTFTQGKEALAVGLAPFWLATTLLSYFCGPAAYLSVSPDNVTIANPLRRYSVPRSLVEGVVGYPLTSIDVRVKGRADTIAISALIPGFKTSGGVGRGTYDTSLGRLRRLLRDIPASESDGTLVRRWRGPHVALLGASVLAMLAAVVYLASHPF